MKPTPSVTVAGYLAGAFFLLFAAAGAAAFLTGDHSLAETMANALTNIVIGISSFYFGSSVGSQKKDEAIAAALKTAPDPSQDQQQH